MMDFEEWYDKNEQELNCLAAESGADREFDWDSGQFAEDQYEQYLKETKLKEK